MQLLKVQREVKSKEQSLLKLQAKFEQATETMQRLKEQNQVIPGTQDGGERTKANLRFDLSLLEIQTIAAQLNARSSLAESIPAAVAPVAAAGGAPVSSAVHESHIAQLTEENRVQQMKEIKNKK